MHISKSSMNKWPLHDCLAQCAVHQWWWGFVYGVEIILSFFKYAVFLRDTDTLQKFIWALFQGHKVSFAWLSDCLRVVFMSICPISRSSNSFKKCWFLRDLDTLQLQGTEDTWPSGHYFKVMRKWPLQFARLSNCTGDVLSEHEMAILDVSRPVSSWYFWKYCSIRIADSLRC